MSTEAILSRQKSKMWHLASGYAMCITKVILSRQNYFCLTKVTFFDKSKFCHDKSTFVQQKLLLLTKVILFRQKEFCLDRITSVDKSNFVLVLCSDGRRRAWSNRRVAASPTLDRDAVSRSRYCSPIEMLWRLLHNICFLPVFWACKGPITSVSLHFVVLHWLKGPLD